MKKQQNDDTFENEMMEVEVTLEGAEEATYEMSDETVAMSMEASEMGENIIFEATDEGTEEMSQAETENFEDDESLEADEDVISEEEVAADDAVMEEDDDDGDDEEDDDEDEVDEEDDEDDDDDDDEYYEEDDPVEVRRQERHRRRVRNQILAMLTMLLFIAIIVGLGYISGSRLLSVYKEKKLEKQLAQEAEEQIKAELERQEEEIIVNLEPEEEEEPEVEEVSPVDQIALAKISEMPLEDKVAGLFIITPEELTDVAGVTKAGETTRNALGKYKVGGIVYTADNIKDSNQIKEMVSNTALEDQNLFLAISEPGGKSSTLASKISDLSAKSAAETTDAASAQDNGAVIGGYLKEYGFNLNMAPIADVNFVEDSRLVAHNDSFGTEGTAVGELAAGFVKGNQSAGVMTCVRTFPGYGAISGEMTEGMIITERTKEEMQSSEFVAYKAAIDAGAEMMMVGTISAPGLLGDNTPACFSPDAMNIIRNELGFSGIIVTDSLATSTITDYYTATEIAEKAIKAGADMIYMPGTFVESYNGLIQAVKDGIIPEERIDESLLRIYRVKYRDKVE